MNKVIEYGTGLGNCGKSISISNLTDLVNITQNKPESNTVSICVDGKIFTKTLIFTNGIFDKVIWNDESGQLVSPPDINLINNSVCQELANGKEVPIEVIDAFDVNLAIVDEYNP